MYFDSLLYCVYYASIVGTMYLFSVLCIYCWYYVFIVYTMYLLPCQVDPCHHGMARPQIADGGTASDMEGSCE
jgi:hypothetical protein